MGQIVFRKQNGQIYFLQKDNIFVANLTKECIMSYYEANALHTKLSKVKYRDLEIQDLTTVILQLDSQIKLLLNV
jgi:hypothetical protein